MRRAMNSEEGFEHVALKVIRDADARVRHHDDQFAPRQRLRYDLRRHRHLAPGRVLDGIADEVLDDLAQLAGIDIQLDVLRVDPETQSLRRCGRCVQVGDVADQDRKCHALMPVILPPRLAAGIVGDGQQLTRHQLGCRSQPAQRQVQFRIPGEPVLQELDIRHDDLRRGPDLVPDLGDEQLLLSRPQFGGPGGASSLDQHRLLALCRLGAPLISGPMHSHQPLRRLARSVRNAIDHHGIDRQQESRHP